MTNLLFILSLTAEETHLNTPWHNFGLNRISYDMIWFITCSVGAITPKRRLNLFTTERRLANYFNCHFRQQICKLVQVAFTTGDDSSISNHGRVHLLARTDIKID